VIEKNNISVQEKEIFKGGHAMIIR
jgi:hypothetical protein